MTAAEYVLHTLALFLGLALGGLGLAYWIAGFANPRTNSVLQNVNAGIFLTASIYLLAFAFTGSLPY